MGYLIKLGALGLLIYLVIFHYWGDSITNVRSLRHHNPTRTAFMGDARRPVQQTWVSLSQMPRHLKQAVLIAEDGTFYQHWGIDFHEFKASLQKNIENRSFKRGFSTITMQLARNLYLTPNKDLTRKFKEILISFYMEWTLSKDRIFELYLNLIELGRGIYGVEAASQYYFSKSVAALSEREAVFLAAIIPSPQRLGRWPPTEYIEARMQVILQRMETRWGRHSKE